MPDKRKPGWLLTLSTSLEDYTIKSIETSRYTIYFSQVSDHVVYDDFKLKPISSDLAIHVKIYKSDEPDLYFTLDPMETEGTNSYTSNQLAEESSGCSIIMKRDHDESICDLCEESMPRGTRLMAFTGGETSSEVHCSCWAELVNSISRELKSDPDLTVAHMI